ncbi:unnamed protein product [Rotaria sp. Silwood1]|nr:unnamed protein product [Rotaria sp. Silwood1]CAF3324802.1 unnamed protein product [Rotaria sp. Silwood1]CAF4523031.1 unnamed protein product [Rotaria sp. Silwood1]CAF4523928.1 unnamed protein product [Rotaria sp. Silwood1]
MEPCLSIEEFVKEFDTPNLTGWKLFSQIPTLTVYRRSHQKLFYYKCFSHLPDVLPETFYKVALDVEYRVVWDKYLKEGRKISDEDKHGVYWQIVMPLFMSNRDTFLQENNEFDVGNRHFYYILTRSEQFQNEPPRKKIIRIENCQSQSLICSDGVNAIFLYCEDPRGSFPKVAWSWVAKFGIPYYAKLTHNACKNYPQWIQDKKMVLPNVIEDDIDSAAAAAAAAAAAMIVPTDGEPGNDANDNDNEDEEQEDKE